MQRDILKIDNSLERAISDGDLFQKYFFERIYDLHKEIVGSLESEIERLEDRIKALDKELIFTHLPPEQCR